MSLTPYERETIVTTSDGDDLVHVWTSQRSVILKLGRDVRWKKVAEGVHDGSPWMEFTIPSDQWNPLSGTKRKQRELTQEAIEIRKQRLARARQTRADRVPV